MRSVLTIKEIQLRHKKAFVDKLLRHCLGRLRNAEDLVGQQSGDLLWKEQPITADHFDPILEIIAAGFSHHNHFDQLDLLDGEKSSDQEIFYQWEQWFTAYLSNKLTNEMIKLFLKLAEVSSEMSKFPEIATTDSQAMHLKNIQNEVLVLVSDSLPNVINVPKVLDSNIDRSKGVSVKKVVHNHKSSPRVKPQERKKEEVEDPRNYLKNWACACTKSGRSPCYSIPCLTECRRSARKGIMLE